MLKIPLSDDVTNLAQVERAPREASVNYDYPYTGAGFTNSTEHLVPEYKFDRFARIKPGAEIWRVDPSGRETLLGIFGEDEVWVKVVPHE
jgi:hypothetical protein